MQNTFLSLFVQSNGGQDSSCEAEIPGDSHFNSGRELDCLELQAEAAGCEENSGEVKSKKAETLLASLKGLPKFLVS